MPFLTFVLLCGEIAVLIKLAQAVGGGIVLLEILLTGAVGFLLLRAAGRSVFEPARLIELLMRRPTRDLVQSLGLLFLGGLLLLLPGLLSDAVGLALVGGSFLRRKRSPRTGPPPSDAIDIDFHVHEDPPST